MLDDLRRQDPEANPEELGWMELDPLTAATRAVVLVGVSLIIGVAGSYLASPDDPGVSRVAAATATAP